jgi:hypothetical protein
MRTFSGTILGLLFAQAILTNPNAINEVLDKGNHTGIQSIQANSDTFSSANPVFGEYFEAIGVEKNAMPYLPPQTHDRF